MRLQLVCNYFIWRSLHKNSIQSPNPNTLEQSGNQTENTRSEFVQRNAYHVM